jgi:hypothetical protein
VGREADVVVLLQEDEDAGEGEDVAPSIGDTEIQWVAEKGLEFFQSITTENTFCI